MKKLTPYIFTGFFLLACHNSHPGNLTDEQVKTDLDGMDEISGAFAGRDFSKLSDYHLAGCINHAGVHGDAKRPVSMERILKTGRTSFNFIF